MFVPVFFLPLSLIIFFALRPAVLLFSASLSLSDKMDINILRCHRRMYEHINVKLGERLQ